MINWIPHRGVVPYDIAEGHRDACVRTVPSPNGLYLWQFRGVCSYAETIAQAKELVEAGIEYFAVFRRNPYRSS